ncbi:hypothetical protein FOZ62_001924, partial [Perkinsus olseni]
MTKAPTCHPCQLHPFPLGTLREKVNSTRTNALIGVPVWIPPRMEMVINAGNKDSMIRQTHGSAEARGMKRKKMGRLMVGGLGALRGGGRNMEREESVTTPMMGALGVEVEVREEVDVGDARVAGEGHPRVIRHHRIHRIPIAEMIGGEECRTKVHHKEFDSAEQMALKLRPVRRYGGGEDTRS